MIRKALRIPPSGRHGYNRRPECTDWQDYPTIGKEAFHQGSNENGKRLIHLAASRNMVIGTTLFPHKDIHKITWRSPDVHHFSQIDHLLIDS